MNVALGIPPEQDWARGCDKCKFGIVQAPELTGACETYLERLVQAIDGDITFCECMAGVRAKVYLKNRFLFLRDEAKRDGRMASFVERNTHPDIEVARKAMVNSYGMVKAPPIRWQDRDPIAPPAPEAVTA